MSNGYAVVSKDWKITFQPDNLVNVLVERDSFIEIIEAHKSLQRVSEYLQSIIDLGVIDAVGPKEVTVAKEALRLIKDENA